MEITVKRGSATHPGPDIVEPLLADRHAMLQRGRQELDGATPADTVRLSVRYGAAADVALGAVVEVLDGFSGQRWRGVVEGLSIECTDDTVIELTLRRPR